MALHCKRAVRGGTGFLYCNQQNLWWENGSVWQVATPNNKPTAIPAPTHQHPMVQDVQFEVSGRALSASDVDTIVITPIGLGGQRLGSKTLAGQAAQAAAAYLFRSKPMDMNVGIAGMITATVELRFSGSVSMMFTVYNDRLAVDQHSRTGYYVASLQSFLTTTQP
jgi:hypothetical protein